jgi:hypothetical protein
VRNAPDYCISTISIAVAMVYLLLKCLPLLPINSLTLVPSTVFGSFQSSLDGFIPKFADIRVATPVENCEYA